MKTLVASIVMVGTASMAFAQAPAPSGPSNASTPHQRDVTGTSDQESMPGMSGSSPADASSPHQRDSLKATTNAAIPANDFVTKAALDGMTEVQAGQLAQQKAQSDGVKKFAQQMITDHTKANAELKSIAANKNIVIPAQLDPEHESVLTGLNGKSASAFDAAYIMQMTAAHDKALALFNAAKSSGDSDIAAFATKTMPTLQMHRQMLSTLQTSAHASNGM